jgi:ferredoxin--NADP+ reductase
MAKQPLKLNARLLQRTEVAPGLLIVQVAPDGWELPEFEPGQYTVLGLPGSAPRCAGADPDPKERDPEKIIRRAYSITSSTIGREYLEFYIMLVRSGELTPRLFALNVGDPLLMGPKVTGMFTLDSVPPDQNVMLFATGTGLAPYMSMIRSSLAENKQRRVAIVHGAYHSWDLGYRAELTTLARVCPHLAYLPLISEPGEEPAPWTGLTGFCQDVWKAGAIGERWGFEPTKDNTHAFLCGHPGMIQGMLDLLTEDGFAEHTKKSPGQIHLEKYW